jgi:hypothetical protein
MGSKPSCRRGDLGEEVWGKIAHLLPPKAVAGADTGESTDRLCAAFFGS